MACYDWEVKLALVQADVWDVLKEVRFGEERKMRARHEERKTNAVLTS